MKQNNYAKIEKIEEKGQEKLFLRVRKKERVVLELKEQKKTKKVILLVG